MPAVRTSMNASSGREVGGLMNCQPAWQKQLPVARALNLKLVAYDSESGPDTQCYVLNNYFPSQ